MYIIVVFFIFLLIIRREFSRILNEVIESRIVNKYSRYIFDKNILINVFKIIIVVCDSYKVVQKVKCDLCCDYTRLRYDIKIFLT